MNNSLDQLAEENFDINKELKKFSDALDRSKGKVWYMLMPTIDVYVHYQPEHIFQINTTEVNL